MALSVRSSCWVFVGRTANLDHSTGEAAEGTLAVAVIHPRKAARDTKTIPASDLGKLGPMNAKLDPHRRWVAVMKEDGLFTVEAAP